MNGLLFKEKKIKPSEFPNRYLVKRIIHVYVERFHVYSL